MGNNGHKQRAIPRRDYYWVCAIVDNRPFVQGPHGTEINARDWGREHANSVDFEVLSFPTIDKTAARDYYKNVLAERGNLIPFIFKRGKYKI